MNSFLPFGSLPSVIVDKDILLPKSKKEPIRASIAQIVPNLYFDLSVSHAFGMISSHLGFAHTKIILGEGLPGLLALSATLIEMNYPQFSTAPLFPILAKEGVRRLLPAVLLLSRKHN